MGSENSSDRCKRLERIESATLELLLKFLKVSSIDDFFELICSDIKDALDIEFCKVLKYDDQKDEFLLISGYGWEKGIVGKEVIRGNSKAHLTLREGKPIYSEDIDTDGRFETPDFLKNHGIVSGLSVPIFHRERIWGVLGIYSRRKRKFYEEEIKFLEAVSYAISEYLEKAELIENLKRGKKRLELIMSHLKDVVVIVDEEGIIRYKSPSVRHVFGWEPEEVVGKHFSEFVHPADTEHLIDVKDRIFSSPGKPLSVEYRVRLKSGGYRWVEATIYLPEEWKELGLEGAIVSERDITEKLNAQEEILRMTYFDPLTGLPNRFLFIQKLEELLKSAERRNEIVGVLVLDLTRFKEVNAVYGIEAGDHVIRSIAYRLVGNLRSGDVVSRFFSDEFGIILANIKDTSGLSKAIEKVQNSFKEPVKYGDMDIYMDANIGVAVFPKDGIEAEELVRKAELALSRTRDMGEGGVAFFSEEIEKEITTIAFIKGSIKNALERRELLTFYQPIVNLANGKVVGMEALVRWRHPDVGLIPPSHFIPVAEESGLILEIGNYVLSQSTSDLRKLIDEGIGDVFLAVNFSAKQFLAENLVEDIDAELKKKGIEPSLFVLEITESLAMKDPKTTKKILGELKSLGIKVAIDDFGTGYSSMNYLIEFDVDKIKIDRSFVSVMLENEKAQGVVKTIIELSHSLGATVLAEGIETKEQLRNLRELGCDEGQGYLFAPPMEFERLVETLKNNRPML